MPNPQVARPQFYFRKIVQFFSGISLEPTLFFIIFTSVMYQLVSQNLYLEKACRVNIGYNSSICDSLTVRNISGYTEAQEVNVQKLVTQMLSIRVAIQSFFPVCLILFLGSWSDRHKRRKPLILVPIVGEMLCCVALIINVIYFNELSLIYTVLGDSLPLALLGGWPCLFIGAYSYVGERCNNNNRTVKMGAMSGSRISGNSLGNCLGGMLFVTVGFLGSFSFCIMSLFFALTFSILLVNEEKTEMVYEGNHGFFLDFFNISYLKRSLKTCFKRGPNERRMKIIVITMLIFIVSGTMQAENNVNYMFTRYKFGWNSVQYGFFTGIKFSVELAGSIIAVIILTKAFHCDETIFGMLGLMGTIIGNTIYALAPSSQYFYLGIICDFVFMLPYIAVRSLIPKTVPSNELGQTNSVFGICEAFVPLIFGPLYTTIYKYTIDVLPGAYFLVTVSLKIVGFCLFGYLFKQSRSERSSGKTLVEKDQYQLQQLKMSM